MTKKIDILYWINLVLISAAIYLVFMWVPTEKTMGQVQKIFYFHVPSAWVGGLAFAVTCFGASMFLAKRDLKWDRLAYSSAEIGLMFTTIALATGSIWAKPAWGVWWAWDARMTSYLVLWLIYLSYVLLRSYIDEPTKRAFLSSVVGIIGFIDVPIVYFSIRWWRTQHPSPVLAGGNDSGLAPDMKTTFFFCLFTFTVYYLYLLKKKLEVEKAKDDVDHLHKVLDNA